MKMPRTVFVKRHDAGTPDEWLEVVERRRDLAELETGVTIGTYQLVEEGVLTTEPEYTPLKRINQGTGEAVKVVSKAKR